MGATISTCVEIAVEMVNASDSAAALGALSANQEFYKSGEFARLLVLADAKRAKAICMDKNNRARKTFLVGSQSGIASGAQLNAMVGEVESIQFTVTGGRWAGTQAGTPPIGQTLAAQLEELRIETRNVTANPEIAPHYVQDGGTVFHNAAGVVLGGASAVSVSATFCTFTINFSATSLQCPDEYTRSIVADALAMGFAKDGMKTAAAAYFSRLAEEQLPAEAA